MDGLVPRWIRWGVLVALAVPQLVTGLWAVVAPRSWFDEFPGFGPALVGAEPPYNHHLATDAGGAFLATGAALLIAAIWPRRQIVMLAIVTYLVFAVPHTIYHAAHESPGLSSGEDVVNVVLLVSGVAAAAVLLWGAWRAGARSAQRSSEDSREAPAQFANSGASSPARSR